MCVRKFIIDVYREKANGLNMWESKFCLHTYIRNKILIRNNSGVQRKVHTTSIQYKYRTNNMFFLVRYVHVAFTNDEKLMVPVRYGTVPH